MTYKELVKQLKEPIPRHLLSSKKQGGTEIKFVSITDIKDLLDSRLVETIWESSVKSVQQIGDQCICVVSITIHASDRSVCQDGTGYEKINQATFGDTASNAYAQAFRRACESHGLGRELWRMELSEEQKEIQSQNQIQTKSALILEIKKLAEIKGVELSKIALGMSNNQKSNLDDLGVGELQKAKEYLQRK